MERKPKQASPPEVGDQPRPGWVTEIRTYKVITPLFGGGEETQKADSITTVRASEVRGHLRFWWRATRGGNFKGNLQAMKQREEEIWGSAAEKGKQGPSNVVLNLVTKKKGSKFQAVNHKGEKIGNPGHPSSIDGYVAFPLRDAQNPIVLEKVEFNLEISYKQFIETEGANKLDIKQDIEDSIWAWETFGGIGARTRRGFGAIQLTHINDKEQTKPNGVQVIKNIENKLAAYKNHSLDWPAGVPHLSRKFGLKFLEQQNGIDAWRYNTKKLRDFRQSFRSLKNKQPRGRTQWPEPDSIRVLLHNAGKYTYQIHIPTDNVIGKFPRAKFGLPIQFEFPDKSKRDPDTTKLQGVKLPGSENRFIDRLASPLILRSLECSDGALCIGLVLDYKPVANEENYTPPGGLVLSGKDYGNFQVFSDLNSSEAEKIPPLNGKTDILQAFLDYLK